MICPFPDPSSLKTSVLAPSIRIDCAIVRFTQGIVSFRKIGPDYEMVLLRRCSSEFILPVQFVRGYAEDILTTVFAKAERLEYGFRDCVIPHSLPYCNGIRTSEVDFARLGRGNRVASVVLNEALLLRSAWHAKADIYTTTRRQILEPANFSSGEKAQKFRSGKKSRKFAVGGEERSR